MLSTEYNLELLSSAGFMFLAECCPLKEQTSISLSNVWQQNYKLGDNLSLPCNVYQLQAGRSDTGLITNSRPILDII